MLTHPNVKARIADPERENAALRQQVQEQAAEIERLRDLVRYERHALHNSGLISNEEFADLVQVQGAVARLEGYDACRQRAEAAEQRAAELAGKLAEAQARLHHAMRCMFIVTHIPGGDCVRIYDTIGSIEEHRQKSAGSIHCRCAIDAALKSQEPQEKPEPGERR